MKIELTPTELQQIAFVLKTKSREDRERAVLLTKGLFSAHNDMHPNRDLAQAFLDQAHEITALVERLEDQI